MISELEIVLRLGLSAVLGMVIGFDRERQNQPAGLRTHTILAIGSCLAMTISINLAIQYQPIANGDPSRLAAQVVSGIGFLGAGAILRYGTNVKGLTTATSLWTDCCHCGVGCWRRTLFCCSGHYPVFVGGAGITQYFGKEIDPWLYYCQSSGNS